MIASAVAMKQNCKTIREQKLSTCLLHWEHLKDVPELLLWQTSGNVKNVSVRKTCPGRKIKFLCIPNT